MEPENKPLARLDFKKFTWFAAILVALATFIVYLPALQNGFVNWDDHLYVYENPNIKPIDYGLRCLTSRTLGLWHPLSCLSFTLDYAIWELNPFGYHLINIIYHALNTFLVYILVLRLTAGNNDQSKRNILVSFLTALFFGLHPLRVESVAWISERKDVLSTFFFLLSILSYFKYISSSHKRFNYLACLIFFALALMSKPMAVSLPVVLLILDFYPLNRLRRVSGAIKFVLIEKLPFFLLSLMSSIITIWPAPPEGALSNLETSSLTLGPFVAMRSFIFYIVKIALPINLAPFYPYPSEIVPFSLEYLISVILLIGITSICLLLRNKGFLAIWAYYLITLLPVSGIIRVGNVAVADRYTYLPSLGPFLLLGIGVWHIFKRYSKKHHAVLAATLFFLFGTLAYKTITQISVWKDSVSLWSHEINLFPYEMKGYYNRATAYRDLGKLQLAIKNFDAVIKLNPIYTDAYNNRGELYDKSGNHKQAIMDYSRAIELKPLDEKTYNNRGVAYGKIRNYQQAIADFDMAVKLKPEFEEAYYNRGIAYRLLGYNYEAANDFSMAIRFNPRYAAAYNNRGNAYRDLGNYQQALKDFNKADELLKQR